MWSRLASISVLSWLIIQAAPALSQAPLQAIPVSRLKPNPPPQGNLLHQQKLVRLEVIAGKVQVSQIKSGQSRTTTAGEPDGPGRQLLVIVATGAQAVTLKYEATDLQTRTLLHWDERRTLLIERERFSTGAGNPLAGETCTLRQAATGELQYTRQAGNSRVKRASGADLWQLALIEPELFSAEIAPLLEACRPDWGLAAMAAEVRSTLVQGSQLGALAERRQWGEWVQEMCSDDFKTRQGADRSLRDVGLPVIRFLERAATREKEPEQRTRIARILQSLAEPKPDTSLLVGQWLVDDPGVWLALLQSKVPAEQVAAKESLSQLLGQPITFQPQAAAAEQAQQIARLRKQLVGE